MQRAGSSSFLRSGGRAALALSLALAGQLLVLPSAQAATILTVSTTADVSTDTGACGDGSITTAPFPLSLREATCLADNIGGDVTINVPAGTYQLTNGELRLGAEPGQNIAIVGASDVGRVNTVIDAGGLSRVLELDFNLTGGISTSISGVVISGGNDGTYGGGGIIAGSGYSDSPDTLTISNSTITDNQTGLPGGGVQFIGGSLNIVDSTISSNSSGSSPGSAIFYQGLGVAAGEHLSINGSTVSDNTADASGSVNGGALALVGASYDISGTSFVDNSVSGSLARGAAIWSQSGALSVTGSTFTGNTAATGGAIAVDGDSAALHYNRFTGNTAASGSAVSSGVGNAVNATENWWGCSTGPSTTGCDTVGGSPAVSPRLTLTASANPATVTGPNATSTITATLTQDSAGAAVDPAQLGAFDGLPVSWTDPQPAGATVSAATSILNAGSAGTTYDSNAASGAGHLVATLDHGTATAPITIANQAPAFTSADHISFVVGSAGSFGITTTGFPTATLSRTGAQFPAWLALTDNGDGTGSLAGTPPAGSAGTYQFTLQATNSAGVTPQTFTLTVDEAPVITLNPVDQPHAQPGDSVSFTAAASGVPAPTVQWQVSTDGGVSFSDIVGATSTTYTFTAALSQNGNQYRAVFSNGVGSPATTTAATLSVGIPPAFTSADHTSFVVGSAGSFSITTTGVPSATLSRTGAQFPAWLTLTDNGDGTGALTGTPPAGSAGTYQFTLKAANGFSPSASQIFTLFVDDSPVITSADHTAFTAGAAGSFAVTTTAGFPTTTALSETGALPSGVTFVDNGDGTATLAGTPAAGTGGSYWITIFATAVGGLASSATQSFGLTVQAPPIITSANHATFSEGSAGSFTVTTTAGNPTTTMLTGTGTPPSGVTFTDNGDGTATLAGTPNIGSQGVYTITITASNGITPDATQTFTLTVNARPVITSVDHATFTVNAAAAFTVTTVGEPTASLSETGSLPPGITFTDNGDGTATLGGTATSGGSYTFTITASNGVLPNATQSFTATVNASPSITSADHTTFAVGSAGSFTVTTTPGVPASTTIAESGSLPSGVTFTDNGDGTGTLAGTPEAGTGGSYILTLTASNGVLPNSAQTFGLTVEDPPVITSADHTTFQLGSAGSFTITTSAGFPVATALTETGALPSGVTFTDNGDGSAILAGTPAAGTGGSYMLTVRASNSAGYRSQTFTLTVTASAVITSANYTTFAVGSAGSFTVTTAPTATTITETGSLPSGVTFTDNGDGTATLAGTPAAGTGGSYTLTFTASNGVLPNSTQMFGLTVTELPSITSANQTTFSAGSAGSFTVTSTAGFPTVTSLSEIGSLPSGVTFTDNGDGTATLAGTPAAGTGGSYPLTMTATNAAGHTDQAFTLSVTAAPVITSADHTTFAVGSAGTFTVTTTPGTPAATSITETGSLPSGVTFHDNGNGTATLAGTPAVGTGGVYSVTITASNGVLPNATQAFTLTVTEIPSITSANHATFIVGSAGSFTVTTHAGFPTATTLTETGTLPAGVTFTDNGDGTATLAGTPGSITAGTYSLILRAGNSAGHTDQAFTLMVSASPLITSANQATFTKGIAGTFTVTTSGGFPAPSALTETGALPTGVTFHDNGNGTATLSGTSTVGGIFSITIHATNGVAPVTDQAFTLTVNGPPVFTSDNTATFLTGNQCGSYTITTTAAGSPGITHVTLTGTLPSGITFHDNGDGTATLSGCVSGITSKQTYSLTLTATNSVGSTTQKFTLIIQAPASVMLPNQLPSSNGTLVGVPATTTKGQVLHLSGSGFAPGAAITIGYYPGPVTLTSATFKVYASSTGAFVADITVTASGSHTYVAAGTGANGNARYLESTTNTG